VKPTIIRLLHKFYPQLLKPLACFVSVIHSYADVSCATRKMVYQNASKNRRREKDNMKSMKSGYKSYEICLVAK
jgi:hypothetical protein